MTPEELAAIVARDAASKPGGFEWSYVEAFDAAAADRRALLVLLRTLHEPMPDIGPSGEWIDRPDVVAWAGRQALACKALAALGEP